MTYVFAQPQAIATAAADVAGIGSTIREANAAAAGSTTSVMAAAQDEVSAAISTLFGNYGQEYQALTAQTALFHDQFVQALTFGGNAYNNTEAASYNALDGSDLVSQQQQLQGQLQQDMLAVYEAERRTDVTVEEEEAAIEQAMDTWAQTANLRTDMLKSVSQTLKSLG